MEDLEARLSAYTDQAIAAVVPPAVPSGLVQWFAGATAPTGWLPADGAAVSRTTYAALYSALGGAGSPHGQGNGSTTFNVPDLRDRAPVGSGSTYTLGAAGGASTVTLTAAQMPAHTHTGPSHTHTGPSHTHTIATGGAHSHTSTNGNPFATTGAAITSPTGAGGVQISTVTTTSTAAAHTHTAAAGGTGATGASGTGVTGSAGTDGSHANLPPYLALLPIIKT